MVRGTPLLGYCFDAIAWRRASVFRVLTGFSPGSGLRRVRNKKTIMRYVISLVVGAGVEGVGHV